MNAASITQYLTSNFEDVVVTPAFGDSFFFYDPDNDAEKNRKFPFVTLVNSNAHDDASDLDRPGVFRLNIGVSKETFQSLFGTKKFDELKGDYDFTALDTLMPHPVYGMMHWLCVLSPSEATFEKVKGLLSEAYATAVSKHS